MIFYIFNNELKFYCYNTLKHIITHNILYHIIPYYTMRKRYDCKISSSYIQYLKLDDSTVLIEESNIDYDNIKLFISLLNETIQIYLDQNYKTLLQYVDKTSYDSYLKNCWKIEDDINIDNIIDENNVIYVVSTPLESAVKNILYGLGYQI